MDGVFEFLYFSDRAGAPSAIMMAPGDDLSYDIWIAIFEPAPLRERSSDSYLALVKEDRIITLVSLSALVVLSRYLGSFKSFHSSVP